LKYILPHISHDIKHKGPKVVQDRGIIESGNLIQSTIYHDGIAKCDVGEIVEIDTWDMC
jgi:hypothetical protein